MSAYSTRFRDARSDRIDGRYLWGDRHLEAVAPTVIAKEGTTDHNYLNEA